MAGRYDAQVDEALGLAGFVPRGDEHGQQAYIHVESAFAEAARSISGNISGRGAHHSNDEDEDDMYDQNNDDFEIPDMGDMGRTFETTAHPNDRLRKERIAQMYRRDAFDPRTQTTCVLCQYVLPIGVKEENEASILEKLINFYEQLVCNRGFDAANEFFSNAWNTHMAKFLVTGTSECRTITPSIVHNHFKPGGCGPKLKSVLLCFTLSQMIELSDTVYESGVYLKDMASVGQKKLITSDKQISSLLRLKAKEIQVVSLIQVHLDDLVLGKRRASETTHRSKKTC